MKILGRHFPFFIYYSGRVYSVLPTRIDILFLFTYSGSNQYLTLLFWTAAPFLANIDVKFFAFAFVGQHNGFGVEDLVSDRQTLSSASGQEINLH